MLSSETVPALSTPGPADDNLVTGSDLRYTLTNLLDNTRAFMPENCGKRHGHIAVAGDFICMAHTGSDDTNQHLSSRRSLKLKLLFYKFCSFLLNYQGSDGGRIHLRIMLKIEVGYSVTD